jgi:hypothetical protein
MQEQKGRRTVFSSRQSMLQKLSQTHFGAHENFLS